ncbi:MAG: HD domain-containing protein [archaeon GB-1845-036]|nr:HD domain-containing protein [Candidatus Culexmicrobium thermophilum]HDO21140.1 HD domain-containing protein [Candidatus Bathyarchaeota archaeon]
MNNCFPLESKYNLLRKRVKRIYDEHWGNYPTSHDYLHVERVLNNAMKIALHENLSEINLHLLKIACLLHDIAIPIYGVKKDHAEISSLTARKILAEFNFNPHHTDIICNAIREHSWSKARKPTNKISAILQDADRLDSLGVIGLIRMVIYGEYKKRKLYFQGEPIPESRVIDDSLYTLDHLFKKLINIPKMMNTYIGRRLADERIKRLLNLVDALKEEIKPFTLKFS